MCRRPNKDAVRLDLKKCITENTLEISGFFRMTKKRSNKEMTDEDFYKYVLMSMYEDSRKTIFVL